MDRVWLWAAGKGRNYTKDRGDHLENARKLANAVHSTNPWQGERGGKLRENRPIQHILGVYHTSNEALLPQTQIKDSVSKAFRSFSRPRKLRDHSESQISVRRPMLLRSRDKSLPRAATKLDHLRPTAALYPLPSSITHCHQSPSPSKDPTVDKFLMRLQSEQILRNGKETERVRILLKSARGAPSRPHSNPRSLLRIATLQDLSPQVSPAEAWTQT